MVLQDSGGSTRSTSSAKTVARVLGKLTWDPDGQSATAAEPASLGRVVGRCNKNVVLRALDGQPEPSRHRHDLRAHRSRLRPHMFRTVPAPTGCHSGQNSHGLPSGSSSSNGHRRPSSARNASISGPGAGSGRSASSRASVSSIRRWASSGLAGAGAGKTNRSKLTTPLSLCFGASSASTGRSSPSTPSSPNHSDSHVLGHKRGGIAASSGSLGAHVTRWATSPLGRERDCRIVAAAATPPTLLLHLLAGLEQKSRAFAESGGDTAGRS